MDLREQKFYDKGYFAATDEMGTRLAAAQKRIAELEELVGSESSQMFEVSMHYANLEAENQRLREALEEVVRLTEHHLDDTVPAYHLHKITSAALGRIAT